MRIRALVALAVALVLAASWARAEEIAGFPLHVTEIEDGVIRLWVGDQISSTAIMAFATEKGIVVVDTFGMPKIDKELREVISRELGRSDFAYLINTHEHADHTGGNSVYDDCTIVGHELVETGMASIIERSDGVNQWYQGRLAELEAELEELPADDLKVEWVKEYIDLYKLQLAAAETGETPPAPSLTFSDRMTLDLGDTTFELFYIGGMHTGSDIAILVPEHGLLLTGDLMADTWLNENPGCLGNFMVRDRMPHDFPRWLANWDSLLARRDEITTLLPAHWNGELSIDGAEARVEYIRTLWDGIRLAANEGANIEAVLTEYRLDTRFPQLAESPGFSRQTNFASITELWTTVTGQASAARTLYRLLETGAEEADILEVLAERGSDSPGYFFFEPEFNAYGYILLQRDMVDEAVELFEINAELYPESWNVYDSLGEALLRAGRTEDATAMYQRSLALNPESASGMEALKKIQEGTAAM